MSDETTLSWIAAVLLNDENSTDEEMVEYFISEGLTRGEAWFYVGQRQRALLERVNFELEVAA